MSAHKLPLHLRQLACLREAMLDGMKDGTLAARIAIVRRSLRLRDQLLRTYGVDAFNERTPEVLRRPVAQRDAQAARLAVDLLRRERKNLRGSLPDLNHHVATRTG
jgi:hypothetical protein